LVSLPTYGYCVTVRLVAVYVPYPLRAPVCRFTAAVLITFTLVAICSVRLRFRYVVCYFTFTFGYGSPVWVIWLRFCLGLFPLVYVTLLLLVGYVGLRWFTFGCPVVRLPHTYRFVAFTFVCLRFVAVPVDFRLVALLFVLGYVWLVQFYIRVCGLVTTVACQFSSSWFVWFVYGWVYVCSAVVSWVLPLVGFAFGLFHGLHTLCCSVWLRRLLGCWLVGWLVYCVYVCCLHGFTVRWFVVCCCTVWLRLFGLVCVWVGWLLDAVATHRTHQHHVDLGSLRYVYDLFVVPGYVRLVLRLVLRWLRSVVGFGLYCYGWLVYSFYRVVVTVGSVWLVVAFGYVYRYICWFTFVGFGFF